MSFAAGRFAFPTVFSLAESCTGVDAVRTKRAGSRELSFVLLTLGLERREEIERLLAPLRFGCPAGAVLGPVTGPASLPAKPFLHIDQHGPLGVQRSPTPAIDGWSEEDLQGSAVALASLFTFMQKEQQLEGWEVVPEHCAAAQLPYCNLQHRVQQFTCNTDWIAAIIPLCLEHEIGGTVQEFSLMISGFPLLCVGPCTRVLL